MLFAAKREEKKAAKRWPQFSSHELEKQLCQQNEKQKAAKRWPQFSSHELEQQLCQQNERRNTKPTTHNILLE